MARGRPAGATEFKRRTLDTTTRSQVNCANEVAVAVCDSRIPSSLFSVGAPASLKGLSEETHRRIVDRAVARFMAVDSVQNQKKCDDLNKKANKKSDTADFTKKIINGERSSVFMRHPMASKECVE